MFIIDYIGGPRFGVTPSASNSKAAIRMHLLRGNPQGSQYVGPGQMNPGMSNIASPQLYNRNMIRQQLVMRNQQNLLNRSLSNDPNMFPQQQQYPQMVGPGRHI